MAGINSNPLYREILVFISQCSIPPTYREIGERLNISSTSVVRFYLDKLKLNGYIDFENFIARSIVLTELGGNYIGLNIQHCPHCGKPININNTLAS